MADDPGIDLADLLAEQEKSSLEGMLADLHRDEQAAKPLNESIEKRRERIKAWYLAHPDDVIFDAERGYVATNVESNKGDTTDLIALAERTDAGAILIGLARAGLLECRVTGLKALRGKSAWADTALRYTHSGGSKYTLKIEKVENA